MKRPGIRAILTTLVFVAAAIQLVPLRRENPPITGPLIDVPPAVDANLRRACYNCHSAETTWPWYSYVAPVSWLVVHDVNDGRRHLNLSEWTAYTPEERAKKRAGISTLIQQGEMPLWYYLPAHPEARLTDEEKQSIVTWADGG